MRNERVLILGGAGMLGHKAYEVFSQYCETFVSFRQTPTSASIRSLFSPGRMIVGIDGTSFETIVRTVEEVRPTVVINCIGIIKQLKESKDRMLSIEINALLPHRIAELCCTRGLRFIHISTDCVFDGTKGGYREEDPADADDIYGKTKYLGEVDAPGSLTLRTSIIGHGVTPNASLVDWFISQRGCAVRGYTRAIYTGFPTVVLCRELVRVVNSHRELSGLYQISSEPISKFDLLQLINAIYRLDCTIEPYEGFHCDRSLRSTRYRAVAQFEPAPWKQMIQEMHRDYREHHYYKAEHETQE